MRLIHATAAALACTLLAGCDQTPAPAPAPPPQQASVLPTPPLPSAPAAPAMAQVHRRHHRHAWSGGGTESGYGYSETYSQSEITGYDYVSDSHVSGGVSGGMSDGDAHRGARRDGYGLWIGGFGRAYDSDAHARRAGTMTGDRLKPWAHYDGDWDR
ncbi:MAG: hypothetical protein ACREHE_13170 [Rhizomicrobium sp.]